MTGSRTNSPKKYGTQKVGISRDNNVYMSVTGVTDIHTRTTPLWTYSRVKWFLM